MRPFNLSFKNFSPVFWNTVFISTDERRTELEQLSTELSQLEQLRGSADYNTGSITLAAAWSLYSTTRYFGFQRALEVGTFIGKSTWAMARAMDREGATGEIATCDASNDLQIPWNGRTKLTQHKKKTSTQMLASLSGSFDFCFFDGRIADEDLPLLDKIIDQNTVIALDDFEGMEKGVANLFKLRTMPKLANHFLVYPASVEQLGKLGFSSDSTLAILLPASRIALTNQ